MCWGAQLSIGSSWQLEAYRKDDALSISGGIADREKGHWVKRLSDGEIFQTPEAVVSAAVGDIDVLCQRITKTMENHMGVNDSGDVSEESLPVLFNEFCTTWGNPEEAQIRRIVDLLAGRGAAYFVIDAGWYKKHEGEDDKWSIEHGDWQCSSRLFPSGIHKLVEYIHQKGMKAGIWFEPENCGRNSEIFRKTELLAQRDGYPITAGNRRFLDMRRPEVWEYLDDRMLRFLRDNGFDYVKIDYNANLGIGPDGGDSLGSALYDSVMATRQYFRHLKEEIPGLLIENCSAGGHRLTGAFLELTDMSSFSDAHECSNIPLVAANMHRMIPVRQSQIWAVLHPEFSNAMLYNKLTAALLGRMCLSGDIEGLSAEQWEIVEETIDFYRQAAPVIAKGISRISCNTGLSYKEPRGSQSVLRTWKDRMLLVIHTFADGPESLEVDAESGIAEGLEIQRICSRQGITAEIEGNEIKVRGLRDFDGIGILLKRSAAR